MPQASRKPTSLPIIHDATGTFPSLARRAGGVAIITRADDDEILASSDQWIGFRRRLIGIDPQHADGARYEPRDQENPRDHNAGAARQGFGTPSTRDPWPCVSARTR